MRRIVSMSLCVFFFCVANSLAGDTADALTQSILKEMTKTLDILTTIQDKPSADAARPKLREVAAAMKALKEKADKLKTTPQRQAELKKKYGPQIDAVLKRMVPEAIRVQTIDGGPEALKALEGLK